MKGCLLIILALFVLSFMSSYVEQVEKVEFKQKLMKGDPEAIAKEAELKWADLEGECSFKAKQLGSDWERIQPFVVSQTSENKNGLITINIKHRNAFGVLQPYKVFCKVKNSRIYDVVIKHQSSLAIP